MFTICVLLLKGLYELIFVPAAPPTLSLVIPGVQIPGSPIFVPFWYGIIALFVVVLVHEFGHGIIAKSHGLKIVSTGIGFMGPLPLAFVEPDEKQVVKQDSVIQHSIFAAGPFFNVLLVGVVMLIALFIVNPLISTMVTPQGVIFGAIQDGYPAAQYGIEKNVVYDNINNVHVADTSELATMFSCVKPNETVRIGNENKTVTLITAASPTDPKKGYMGVTSIKTNYVLKSQEWWFKVVYYLLFMLSTLLDWVMTLSLGIGLANLLPLGPVDGGRMLNKAAIDINGKKNGTRVWATVSIVTLVIMILLLFVPIIKHVLFKV
jgi:membrane-associated protease RseP (regulator of RpoE activity)